MIGYLDKKYKTIILKMPKMNGYIKTFKVKEGNNKSMSLRIDDEKLLQRYKAISTKTEDLKIIKLNALPVYANKYTKAIIKTFGDKVRVNLH